jgi:hypothetical protein
LTDFSAAAFPFAGISGVLEVTGLAMWGTHLWLIMAGRARVRRAVTTKSPDDSLETRSICANDSPGRVLDHFPQLLPTFAAHGFAALTNPQLRATVGRVITIEQACRRMGVDLDQFLTALNRARDAQPDRRADLPMVSFEKLTSTFPKTSSIELREGVRS